MENLSHETCTGHTKWTAFLSGSSAQCLRVGLAWQGQCWLFLLPPLAHRFNKWRHWCEHLYPGICCSGLGLCRVTYTMSWVRTSTKLFCCQAQLWAVLCSVGWKVCAVHALIINTYIKIDLRAPRVPQTFEHKSDCPRAMHLANAHPSEVWARNYLQSYQRLLFAWVGRPSEGKTFPLTASYRLCFDIISAALISSFAHANTFPTLVPFNFQLVSLQENIDKGLLHFLPFLSSPDNFL